MGFQAGVRFFIPGWFVIAQNTELTLHFDAEREAGISPSRRSSAGNAFVKVHQSRLSKVTQNTLLEDLYLSPAGILNPATPAFHARKTHLETRSP